MFWSKWNHYSAGIFIKLLYFTLHTGDIGVPIYKVYPYKKQIFYNTNYMCQDAMQIVTSGSILAQLLNLSLYSASLLQTLTTYISLSHNFLVCIHLTVSLKVLAITRHLHNTIFLSLHFMVTNEVEICIHRDFQTLSSKLQVSHLKNKDKLLQNIMNT